MQIAPGSRLGPYEIISRIGAGGMGEVWRARDTRLERDVAIKVLPPDFAQNAELKMRFEREAKTISQLNHPHICTLHDVGEARVEGARSGASGTSSTASGLDALDSSPAISYLVMELIDGENLADRLTRGPLPVTDVLRYGIEIAEALDKAHRAGIVHRDLKPGNVMLTKSGSKLLDFGLAKTVSVGISPVDATIQKQLTQEGTILGTFQYMSPEQLEGTEADARTDIFALGALLYEMVTGKRAFEGKTRTSLIAAIVDRDPVPMSQLQPLTPPPLEHVISRCLEKDPHDRWQSAHDVAEELRWIGEAGSMAGVAAPVTIRRKTRERLAWALNLLTAVVAVASTWAYFTMHQPVRPTTESSILTPQGMRVVLNGGVALSPDARSLVVVFEDLQSVRTLWLRPLNSGLFRQLVGTEDASYPFWSPDSRRIGFFSGGRLKTIEAAGGSVQTLCDAAAGRGGAWSSNGIIVFAPGTNAPLMKVPATGGVPETASQLRDEDSSHRWPYFLPDQKHFIFFALGRKGGIFRGSLDAVQKSELVAEANSSALYSSSGHLLYARNNTVVAQAFDPTKGKAKGDPIVIANDVAFTDRFTAVYTAASDGTLVFLRGSGFQLTQLVWVDRSGKQMDPVAPPGLFFSPTLSHDQKRLAVDVSNPSDGQGDLWIWELDRGVSSRLTFDPSNESSPLWSPDDRRMVYQAATKGQANIYGIGSGGTGVPELLFEDEHEKRPTDVSNDGKWVLFNSDGGAGRATDIWVYSVADKKARPWLATPFSELAARLSPDGRWIAYQSDEAGRHEIYVRAFPDGDEKWLLSTGGGVTPSWRGDGREIYYASPDRKMMAVSVSSGATFEASAPAALFDAFLRPHPIRQYDVAPDGSRFLLNRRLEQGPGEPLTLLQNWQELVK